MKIKTLLVCLAICTLGSLTAQDQHFTQFYASPLTLNPGLTGAFNGKYRLALIYRDQWRGALDFPFTTFSAAADFRFNLDFFRARTKDAAGAGILFYNDQVPGFDISNNQIHISTAYHKFLGGGSTPQYLSLGIQVGINQRNIGYSKLRFADQFNGSTGYTDPTAENLPANNYAFSDLGVGLNYTYSSERSMSVFSGLAVHHVTQPEQSFYEDPDLDNPFPENRLLMKFSGYLNFQIPLSERLQIHPRALFISQGAHLQINAGTNFRILINDISGIALHLGTWARPVSGVDNQFELDALILMTGVELNNFLLGFSYDANFNDLTGTNNTRGAFEISFAYLGEYENEAVLCPKF